MDISITTAGEEFPAVTSDQIKIFYNLRTLLLLSLSKKTLQAHLKWNKRSSQFICSGLEAKQMTLIIA